MTDQEITALAREYAEFTDLSPVDKKNVSLICKCFLEFLLRRYCLVEKSKVESTYNRIWNEWNFSLDAENKANSKFILSVLESLFPDLGKEAEE